jgi:hypothetical protein
LCFFYRRAAPIPGLPNKSLCALQDYEQTALRLASEEKTPLNKRKREALRLARPRTNAVRRADEENKH